MSGTGGHAERRMRVLVTGAYGLIGAAVLSRLHRDGHKLVAAGRRIAEASRRAPYARWVEADYRKLTLAGDWLPLLEDVDAVVNCVGVLQDGARDNVRRVHVEATTAMFAACERRGLRRVIHVSAIGADRLAPTAFARSKAEAEADLATRHLDWVVIRPALVLAPSAYGGTALLRALGAVPFVTPVIHPDAKLQVVGVDDVAETVAHCLRPGGATKVRWDVAYPEPHTLGALVAALRDWQGFPRHRLWTVPNGLAGAVAAVGDAIGFLGWRSPARTTALRQLAEDVVGDPAPWMEATGIRPMALSDIMLQTRSSAADRWFARLYLLKPLAIVALALFWVLTGMITLGPGRAAAMAHLKAAGFPAAYADPILVAGSFFDYVLGVLLLLRPATRLVLLAMLAVTPLYMLAGTVLAPQLWLDPLGPLLKLVPLLIATLFTLAILDDR
jgi:uncharacterized protein YbjT (DUF2867 family)